MYMGHLAYGRQLRSSTMSPAWFRINIEELLTLAGEDETWNGQDKIVVDLGADGLNWGPYRRCQSGY